MDNIEKLKAEYIQGTASPEQINQLLELCKEDKELLDSLSGQVTTERLLKSLAANLELNGREIIEQISNEPPDISAKVIDKIDSKDKRQSMIINFFMAAAAIITFALIPSKIFYAYVEDTLEAKWTHKESDQLAAGNYSLLKGYAKLKFKSGAEVIVEGPSDFKIINDMHIYLTSGKVVADIPPSAHGFKVDTMNSNTIDLGTKFAVATNNKDETEIHVIEGLVKSKSINKDQFTELRKDEALKVTRDNSSKKQEADSGKFLTMLPPEKVNALKYILWRFDEGKGNKASEISHGYEKAYSAQLKSTAGKMSIPKWVDGKFGKAVKFDGKTNYVQTDFPGIGGANSRTVCFWVKADKKEKNGYAIITWGSFEKYGATWQISLNPTKEDGPLGRIRCGTHKGQVIGTKDLRDNKWHHVAVVMYGGHDADVSTHILIYIDGELENAYRKSVQQIDTDIESQNAVKLQMGKNAAVNHGKNPTHKYFRGALDEVYVFNYALNPNEIRQIISNTLKLP